MEDGRRIHGRRRNASAAEDILVGEGRPLKRLVIVAEDSLIVEAIAIALRKSGEFQLLAPVDPEPPRSKGSSTARPR